MTGLFGEPLPPVPAAVADPTVVGLGQALRTRFPTVRFGTSSWTFSGWEGLVYRQHHTPSVLARQGLPAYAAHPVLRTVGVDRAYYGPVPSDTYRAWADSVPPDFRFLVKAPASCTRLPDRGERPSATCLALEPLLQTAVDPMLSGLGDKAGVFLLQFSRQDLQGIGGLTTFTDRLAVLLAGLRAHLPTTTAVAVEVRDSAWMTPDYVAALRDNGATHCLNIYPGMPTLRAASRVLADLPARDVVIRWMLHPAMRYQEAKAQFAPFKTLAAPHPQARNDVAAVVQRAASQARSVWVIANNKAEGSAPRTLQRLAHRLLQPQEAAG